MIILGWIGGITLALSSIPQLLRTIRDGHADGLSGVFIASWLIGEVLSLVYVAPTLNWPIIANYSINLLILLGIVYYKVWPRSSRKSFFLTRDERAAMFKKSGGEVG